MIHHPHQPFLHNKDSHYQVWMGQPLLRSSIPTQHIHRFRVQLFRLHWSRPVHNHLHPILHHGTNNQTKSCNSPMLGIFQLFHHHLSMWQ